MTYRGHVKNNVIVLEAGASLPEGTQVSVEPLPNGKHVQETAASPNWAETFAQVQGKAQTLPEDMAQNHDHYLHGVPKK
jgi:hypothetical protein